MSLICSNCGVAVADGTLACPVCGEEMGVKNRPSADLALSTSRRLAAAGAYFTFIPAAIFLLTRHFRTDRFVRFHSFQSIFLLIVVAVLGGMSRLTFTVFSFIPFLVATLVLVIFCLGSVVLWVLLVVKALQGQEFKLPWIGELAEKQAYG